MSFAGKTALVTGGSRGIGRAIVQALAREGCKVGFVYASNADSANSLVEELTKEGSTVTAWKCDVRDKTAAENVVNEFITAYGRLDILVNNAGIIRDTLLATMGADQWKDVIDTNLTSVYNFCQSVTRQMMGQRYGRIINMSSVAAEFGNKGQANYAASKGGIDGFTRCLATELAKRNITVNAIAPGFIETDMTEAVRNAAEAEIKKHIPANRLGKPEDIAQAVLFFASDAASYVTGQVLRVDGGLTLGGF